tara:strand:- start:648 stop:884 length:237 start_codon:yes stop_codon:yes gene_type:complete
MIVASANPAAIKSDKHFFNSSKNLGVMISAILVKEMLPLSSSQQLSLMLFEKPALLWKLRVFSTISTKLDEVYGPASN